MPVRELNQRTSAVLAEVADGVAVTITSDGRPVARLVPVPGGSPVLDELVAQGRARAATLIEPIPIPPRYGDESLDVADRIAEARDEERW